MSRVSTAGPETAALASQITARDQLDLQKKELGLQAQQLRLQQQQQQIELEALKQQGQLAREQMGSQEAQTAAELAQRTYFAEQRIAGEERQQQAEFQQQRTMFDLGREAAAEDFQRQMDFSRQQFLEGRITALEAEERDRALQTAKFRAQAAAKAAELKAAGKTDEARRLIAGLEQDIVTRIREAENSTEMVGMIGDGISEIAGGAVDVYSSLLVQRRDASWNAVVERDLTGRSASVLEGFQGGRVTWDYEKYLEAEQAYRAVDPDTSTFWRPLMATLEFAGFKTPVEGGEYGFARTRVDPIPPEDATRLLLLEASRRLPDATGRAIGGGEVARALEVVESFTDGSVKDPNLAKQEIEQLVGGRGELVFSMVRQMRTQLEQTANLADLERRLSPEDMQELRSRAGGRENLQIVLDSVQATAKRMFQLETGMRDLGFVSPDDAVSDLEGLADAARQLDLTGAMSPETVRVFREMGMGEQADQIQKALEAAEFEARAGVESELEILGSGLTQGDAELQARLQRDREELARLGVGGGGE